MVVFDCEFTPPVDKVEQARRILAKPYIRPHPKDIKYLKDTDIDQAAIELGYPVYEAEPYLRAHEGSLPFMRLAVNTLLFKHEKERPYYFIIARDGEMMYDALVSLNHLDLSNRVRLVATSGHNRGHIVPYDPNESQYLKSIGLSRNELEKGRKWIFVDAGYNGTEFKIILEHYLKIEPMDPFLQNVYGYLIYRNPDSTYPYKQLGWLEEPPYPSFADIVHSEIINREIIGHDNFHGKVASNAERASQDLCDWMQIQPKFNFKYTNYVKDGDLWIPLPPESLRAYPVKGTKTILDKPSFGNDDIVDPVLALKLQRRTVNYFDKD